MKAAIPAEAKINMTAKETMQECVSEFISFITSEGVFTILPSHPIYLFLIVSRTSLGEM